MRIDYGAVLDFLLLGLQVFSRRDCGLILAGYRPLPGDRYVCETLDRMQRQGLVEREGRGANAQFRITASGRAWAALPEPAADWDRAWDGRWRVVTYDLPESRRAERLLLLHALHARRLGLLQRSVWIWPHPLETMLREVIEAEGIPECFCGFDAHRLFLCETGDVVRAAWDFKAIAHDHQAYLDRDDRGVLRRVEQGQALIQLADQERRAYRHAFRRDPCLPRCLWPAGYGGPAVVRAHDGFRKALAQRLHAIRPK